MNGKAEMDSCQDSRFWDQLLELIDDGRVIPIVGRDLLTLRLDGREAPLYAHLAGQLAEYLGVPGDGLPAGRELDAVASRYLAKAERGRSVEDIYAALKVVMRRAGDLPIPEPLLRLADIESLQLFVTTTFDSLLERAINQTRFGGRPKTQVLSYSPTSTTDLPVDGQGLAGPAVFHLLGRLSTVPDYAVTDEDLLEFVHALQSETRRPNRLLDELARNHLLVLGCSYPDWLARFFIRAAAGDRLSQASHRSFIADSSLGEDETLREFLEFSGVVTQCNAIQFIDELHRRWLGRSFAGRDKRIPSREELVRFITIEPGAVFLSYAKEDSVAAEKIKKSLERAGIDVWFDKIALQPGDTFEETIRDNIENCSVFVPIISRHTLTAERRYFRREWSHAEKAAEMASASARFIVPVAIDDTSPDEKDLPRKFRELHWQVLEGGEPTPEFVEHLRSLFRDYHRAQLGGAA